MKKPSKLMEELKKERQRLDSNNYKIVDFITETCLKNIKMINSSGRTSFIYEVPPFLLGFPVYDLSNVSISVNKKLKKLGFFTTFLEINKILIKWS